MRTILSLGCLLLAILCGLSLGGFTNTEAQEKPISQTRITEFEQYLSNSVLTGVFTIDGKALDKQEPESYEIKSAKKLEGYDALWEITARIKYGNKDVELPVEINIEWAGKTPVMVMDSMTIPGLGTFSARVVFHDGKYAGTWKHDAVGGHMFGRVSKKEAAK